ncbi:MAG: 50S ribosomal protein L32 [Planctomycetes bacterium]|nr:50S ribosomal protein L32 [Planctomycetota bacterium]
MPLPKRRHSKSRSAKKRANDFVKAAGTSLCPHCGHTKLPHRVCGNCGYYRDKEVVAFEE